MSLLSWTQKPEDHLYRSPCPLVTQPRRHLAVASPRSSTVRCQLRSRQRGWVHSFRRAPSSGPMARPERRCSLHPTATLCNTGPVASLGPGAHPALFQRQPSSATFSSNQSDNGLDSDDEAPLEGVISNGSKLEVEVDIHCCAFQLRSGPPESPKDLDGRHDSRGSDYPNSKMRRQNSVVVSATNGCLLAVCGREISDLKKSPSTSSLFGRSCPTAP